MLKELGITREDILDKAAEKLLASFDEERGDLSSQIKEKVSREIIVSMKGKVESLLQKTVSDLVDTPFMPVDEWGQPQRKESTTLRKMVKDRAVAFLTEQVDSDGKANSYRSNMSRGEWLARKAAESVVDFECKKELTKAVETAKAEIKKRVADHITEILIKK